MKIWVLLLTIMILLYPFSVQAAETDSLWVGNMSIKLGMDKTKVISMLSENYEVLKDNIKSEDPSWENWSIYKKTEKRKAEDLVGMVAFKKNKVSWIGKPWGSFGGSEAASFGHAFAGVLSGLIEKGKSSANIQLRQVREPGISYESIYINFGKHDITLTITEGGIQIQENLYNE